MLGLSAGVKSHSLYHTFKATLLSPLKDSMENLRIPAKFQKSLLKYQARADLKPACMCACVCLGELYD